MNNLIGIIILLLFLQFLRIFFDAIEKKESEGSYYLKINLQKNLLDLFANIVIFTGIYFSILYSNNQYVSITGYALCLMNIIRVIKYRLYDDIVKRALGKGGYVGPKSTPIATLYQGLFNILTRTYFFIVISFACIYIILIKWSYEYNKINHLFKIEDHSNNMFVDFMYFSIVTISTVGFGDITPLGVIPKILCSLQIVFGFFILATIFSFITSFYISSITTNRNKF